MTRKQITALRDQMRKHHEDYIAGKAQNFDEVFADCGEAASLLTELLNDAAAVLEYFADNQKIAADAPVYVATRKDILQQAARRECADDCFEALADMWTAYSRKHFSAQDVAMMLALLHVVRIGRGYGSEESFADLAGYAACGGEYWAKYHAAAQMACCAEEVDDLAAD